MVLLQSWCNQFPIQEHHACCVENLDHSGIQHLNTQHVLEVQHTATIVVDLYALLLNDMQETRWDVCVYSPRQCWQQSIFWWADKTVVHEQERGAHLVNTSASTASIAIMHRLLMNQCGHRCYLCFEFRWCLGHGFALCDQLTPVSHGPLWWWHVQCGLCDQNFQQLLV